jgi:hypothetical protein
MVQIIIRRRCAVFVNSHRLLQFSKNLSSSRIFVGLGWYRRRLRRRRAPNPAGTVVAVYPVKDRLCVIRHLAVDAELGADGPGRDDVNSAASGADIEELAPGLLGGWRSDGRGDRGAV